MQMKTFFFEKSLTNRWKVYRKMLPKAERDSSGFIIRHRNIPRGNNLLLVET